MNQDLLWVHRITIGGAFHSYPLNVGEGYRLQKAYEKNQLDLDNLAGLLLALVLDEENRDYAQEWNDRTERVEVTYSLQISGEWVEDSGEAFAPSPRCPVEVGQTFPFGNQGEPPLTYLHLSEKFVMNGDVPQSEFLTVDDCRRLAYQLTAAADRMEAAQ